MSDNGQARCDRCDGSGMRWEGNFHVLCGCRENDETDERGDGQQGCYPPELDEEYAQECRERAKLVREAQAFIEMGIDLIERAIQGHEYEDNWDAYVVAHLKILASGDHGYLSRDTNLDDVIRQLGGREDEEDW